MAARLIGRSAINARIAEIAGKPQPAAVHAAAHVICRMGGHIPNIDNEQPGACDFHIRQAAVALEQTGWAAPETVLMRFARSLSPRARKSLDEGAYWVRLPAAEAQVLLDLLGGDR